MTSWRSNIVQLWQSNNNNTERLQLTYLLHGGGRGQEALLQQLLPGLLVLHLDLRHHVARHEAQAAAGLSPVEAVWVFVSVNLGRGARSVISGALSSESLILEALRSYSP